MGFIGIPHKLGQSGASEDAKNEAKKTEILAGAPGLMDTLRELMVETGTAFQYIPPEVIPYSKTRHDGEIAEHLAIKIVCTPFSFDLNVWPRESSTSLLTLDLKRTDGRAIEIPREYNSVADLREALFKVAAAVGKRVAPGTISAPYRGRPLDPQV